jgi:putative ABC transport system permease protein
MTKCFVIIVALGGGMSVDALVREARFALRLLLRRPGFTAVALVTLALGIGAPTAIFSVVQAVLLRPLPYPEADRLVRFRMEGQGNGRRVSFDALPASEALEWGLRTETLAGMALFDDRALTLSSANGPYRLVGSSATPNLFDVLGVSPQLGQTFDARSRDPRRVVLSYEMWQQHLAGNPAVVGSSIVLDGEPYVVTGVMPRRFDFPAPATAFWVPLIVNQSGTRGMLLPAIARLRADATVAGMLTEGRRLIEETADGMPRHTLSAQTIQDQMVGGVRRILWVLMTAVVVVFVIAGTNIALLLLTRGAARQREFSVRVALGAGRASLVRQLVIESAILAFFGGSAGLLVAALSLNALLRLAPADMPRLQEATLDGGVLAFAGVLTLLTSIVFGVLSAGRAVATDPLSALGRAPRLGFSMRSGQADDAPGTSGSRRRLNLLVIAELSLTTVLLVGAGLLLRSFVSVLLVDQGFRHRGALALQINLPAARYPNPAARLAFHEQLLDRLKAMKGIESAGLITMMPNRQPSARFDFNAGGRREFFDPLTTPVAEVRTVSEGFIEAMGIPLLAGRSFQVDDRDGAEPVMVISEALARQHFPDGHAVGRILYSGTGDRRVIGVVGDVRPAAQDREPAPSAYLTMRQDADVFQWFGTVTLVVRGSDLRNAAASLRTLVLSMDPEMPPFNVRTLSDEVAGLVAGPRFSATVLGLFAAIALALAAVGVYGVMAYAAAQRTREIGVRVALGATRAAVLRLMLRDGLIVVGAGLAVGLPASLILSRALTGLLHDVAPADPLALVGVTAVLASIGVAAAYVPARRATRISALEALREE